MKRVLMLNYEFPPLGGGAANATLNLLREFAKRDDIAVDLVTSALGPAVTEKFSENIRIFRLDIGKRRNAHSQSVRDLIAYSGKALIFSRKLCATHRYDLCHAFFGLPCGAIACALGLPYIVSLRGSDVPGFNPRFKVLEALFLKRMSRHILSRAKMVVANSEPLKALALKTWNGDIEVIPNGVDGSEFSPAAAEPSTFTVVSTSRLTARKNIDILIKGFALFSASNPNSRLIVAGRGDQEHRLRQLARSFAHVSIEFRGEIPHERTPDLYRTADVFALLSDREGMSNSLLEAMASGLALIMTETAGDRQRLASSALIITAKERSVAYALEKIYKDRAALVAMKNASRAAALSFGWDFPAQKYAEIYEEA